MRRRAGGPADRRTVRNDARLAVRPLLALLPLPLFLPLLPLSSQEPPPLPGAPHVLALARAPDSTIWAGTYGDGIYVLRPHGTAWTVLRSDTTGHSISWDFVHAFAFDTTRGAIWYGTLGNGWGRSTDGGATWTNWTFSQLGPEYQYVAPNGIVLRRDTVYVATADGVKVSGDGGASWLVITDSMGVRSAKDSVLGTIGNQYVLALAAGPDGALWLSHPHGLERSRDGGRTWQRWDLRGERARVPLPLGPDSILLGTERGLLRADAGAAALGTTPVSVAEGEFAVQALARATGRLVAATSAGLYPVSQGGRPLWSAHDPRARFAGAVLALPGGAWLVGSPEGIGTVPAGGARAPDEAWTASVEPPSEPRHTWFARPVLPSDQPYIDQTYRYGSTMGGNFQQHQGVEFNAGEGTPTHAIGDGVVAYAGPAEAGALTVAIRHDRKLVVDGAEYHVFSVYYHHSALLVTVGQRVKQGDAIGRVGNTGRATNDHLHLEVHAVPFDSVALVVDPNQRYPQFSTNPELWIRPLSGTGVVAGRVFGPDGQPLRQARVYGIVKGEPQETPFAFAETYGDRTRGTPAYREHFAVGDVPAGEYVLYVPIGGQRVTRRVRVEAGRVTWVEFRP